MSFSFPTCSHPPIIFHSDFLHMCLKELGRKKIKERRVEVVGDQKGKRMAVITQIFEKKEKEKMQKKEDKTTIILSGKRNIRNPSHRDITILCPITGQC